MDIPSDMLGLPDFPVGLAGSQYSGCFGGKIDRTYTMLVTAHRSQAQTPLPIHSIISAEILCVTNRIQLPSLDLLLALSCIAPLVIVCLSAVDNLLGEGVEFDLWRSMCNFVLPTESPGQGVDLDSLRYNQE